MSQIILLTILLICKAGLYFFLYLVNPYLMYALACIHIAGFAEYVHKRLQRHVAFEQAFSALKAKQADAQTQKLNELYGRAEKFSNEKAEETKAEEIGD